MRLARCTRFAAVLLMLLVAAVNRAAAQGAEQVIVQFRDDAVFDTYAADYQDDERTAAQGRSTYHRKDVVGAAMALERRHGFRATNFYSHALKGFAARVTPAQRRALEANPLVYLVEQDVVMSLDPDPGSEQIVPWGIPKISADVSTARSGDGSGDVTGVTLYIVDTRRRFFLRPAERCGDSSGHRHQRSGSHVQQLRRVRRLVGARCQPDDAVADVCGRHAHRFRHVVFSALHRRGGGAAPVEIPLLDAALGRILFAAVCRFAGDSQQERSEHSALVGSFLLNQNSACRSQTFVSYLGYKARYTRTVST